MMLVFSFVIMPITGYGSAKAAVVLVVEADTDQKIINETLDSMNIDISEVSYIDTTDVNNYIDTSTGAAPVATVQENITFLEHTSKVIEENIERDIKNSMLSYLIEEEEVVEEPVEVETLTLPVLDQKATKYDDLAVYDNITVHQMNYVIDQFDTLTGGTPFKNHGDIFIEAAELSGLNPLYLFAHASLETGYGTSSLARNKGNYFGIGAYDSNPTNAYNMGDTMRDGIVNGAIWIKENFYNNEQTTLYDMIYKYENHYYASSGDEWINGILWIMNKYALET